MIDALRTLELDDGATIADVKRAFRSIVKKAHPDHGGDTGWFLEVRRAYEEALRHVRSRPKRPSVEQFTDPVPDAMLASVDAAAYSWPDGCWSVSINVPRAFSRRGGQVRLHLKRTLPGLRTCDLSFYLRPAEGVLREVTIVRGDERLVVDVWAT